jgi:para-nitrobenzyl esterase
MTIGRRSWLKTAGFLAFDPLVSAAPDARAPDSLSAKSSLAVARTESGRVRGFVRQGILTFRGVPYGASTAGERRFLPPSKPTPWKGVRSSLTYGYVSPQEPRPHWDKDEVAFVYQWDDGVQNEDCLRLNVWTPELDGKKRPVMVWLHGGAFSTGSAHDMKTYDGENLRGAGTSWLSHSITGWA